MYVDKTKQIHDLIKQNSAYFFSRPRRFGKSLLLSTMKAIFEGKRALFKGLAIDSMEYDWKPYPVILLSLSSIKYRLGTGLNESLQEMLYDLASDHGVTLESTPSAGRYLMRLVKQIAKKYNQKVVVLVDEYDKPILDAIEDPVLANTVRQELRDFYVVLKDLDEHLQFLFLTGVSRFSRTSIFSGLNQLKDISFDLRMSSLCGYTEEEVDRYFSDHIQAMQQYRGTQENVRDMLRVWYDGYLFHKNGMRVYNPFSMLNVLDTQEWRNYWFASGTPTFLLFLLKEQHFNLLADDALTLSGQKMSDLIIENLDCLSVLYQTGYVTIDHYDEDSDMYRLKVSNLEVKRSLFGALLDDYVKAAAYTAIYALLSALKQAVVNNNVEQMIEHLKTMYAKIPYTISIPLERYYQTIFYTIFLLAGFDIIVEDATNEGRIDVVVTTKTHRYIIELKLNRTAAEAIEQIKSMNYAAKFADDHRSIVLVGINFDSEKRMITEWMSE